MFFKFRIHFSDDGSIRLKQETTFFNGVINGYTNYDSSDNITGNGHYELNSKGQKISYYHNGELEEEYQYNEMGQIELVRYATGAKDWYAYDNNGFASRQLSILGEFSFFGGPKEKMFTFLNDAHGNIVEMKVFDNETKLLISTQENKINREGDIVECKNFDGNGSIQSITFTDYEYDKKQNWTVRKISDNNGRLIREEKRLIAYYSE